MTRAATLTSRSSLTTAAGWIAVAFGTAHVVVAPLGTSATWSQVWAEGWWNTFTLDSPTTFDQAERSSVFWTTLGSFGVPILALGCHIIWSAHRRQRVPGRLGWLVLIWGVPFVTALPASPGWTIPLIGALIVAGDRPPRPCPQAVPGSPTPHPRESPVDAEEQVRPEHSRSTPPVETR